MVGIKPVPDALGRVNKLEVIPLEELGRPRVDVVVNCSGVFRDLFVNQMNLLDRAVKMAAELDEPDEMNFVRKHARKQVGFSSHFLNLWADHSLPCCWTCWQARPHRPTSRAPNFARMHCECNWLKPQHASQTLQGSVDASSHSVLQHAMLPWLPFD